MIKTVIKLDTQYWVLLDVPKQEKQEQMSVYVLRCCSSLEKALDTRTSDGAKTKAERQAEEDQREKDRKQRFDGNINHFVTIKNFKINFRFATLTLEQKFNPLDASLKFKLQFKICLFFN